MTRADALSGLSGVIRPGFTPLSPLKAVAGSEVIG